MELLLLLGASVAYLIYCYTVFVCTNYYITGAYLFGFTLVSQLHQVDLRHGKKKKKIAGPSCHNLKTVEGYTVTK